MMMILLTQFILLSTLVSGLKIRNAHYHYSVKMVEASDETGSTYQTTLSNDLLSCMAEDKQTELNIVESLLCFLSISMPYCEKIWGDRSVVVEVAGSVEILQLSQSPIPMLASTDSDSILLSAHHWLSLKSSNNATISRKIVQVPAEPLYLCARSVDWQGDTSDIKITFRHAFMRERHRRMCLWRLFSQFIALCAFKSARLLPWMVSAAVGVITFHHGLEKIMLLLGCGTVLLICLTPFMLKRKHRHHAKRYLFSLFSKAQADEARGLIRERLPLFQALYFSSCLLCFGSLGIYMIHCYFGISRDERNLMLRVMIAASLALLTNFVCRSFERFFVEWSWIALAVFLSEIIFPQLNPLSRDKVFVVLALITFGMEMILRKLLQVKAVKMLLEAINNQLGKIAYW
eukprot:scaffold659_cov192-Ochromonas_danica.AAC.74